MCVCWRFLSLFIVVLPYLMYNFVLNFFLRAERRARESQINAAVGRRVFCRKHAVFERKKVVKAQQRVEQLLVNLAFPPAF